MKLRLVVLVAALTVTVVAIAVVAWPRSTSAEDRARQEAKTLACNISQVGLGVRPCAPVKEFRKTGANTWRFRIEGPARRDYRCYELNAAVGPLYPVRQVPCG